MHPFDPFDPLVKQTGHRIGATIVWDRGDWSPTFRLGTNNLLVPQLLGLGFQKARNFTASSHQNAGFSIWVFKKFSGGDTHGPSQREGTTPSCRPAPNTQPGLWPGVGRKRPGVGTKTLVPLNFSAVFAHRWGTVMKTRPIFDATPFGRLMLPANCHRAALVSTWQMYVIIFAHVSLHW